VADFAVSRLSVSFGMMAISINR